MEITDKELLSKITEQALRLDDTAEHFGRVIFKLYTSFGLPPDIALEEIEKTIKLDEGQKFYIIYRSLSLFSDHQRISGIGKKRENKLVERNNEALKRFLKTGKCDIY